MQKFTVLTNDRGRATVSKQDKKAEETKWDNTAHTLVL